MTELDAILKKPAREWTREDRTVLTRSVSEKNKKNRVSRATLKARRKELRDALDIPE